MILYLADRSMNILGVLDSSKGSIAEDKKTEEIATGTKTFEVTLFYHDAEERFFMDESAAVGNYLLREDRGEAEIYQIITASLDTSERTIEIYAEEAGMELINDIAKEYEADKAYSLAYYFNKWLEPERTGYSLGINQVSTLTRKLKWDSSSTVMERLASVATQFDNAEIEVTYTVEGMKVTDRRVNVYKQRGTDIGATLRIGQDIVGITIEKNGEELATALDVTGGTPDGAEDPITLKGYTYDDGDFCIVSSGLLKSREAMRRWCRPPDYTSDLVAEYSYDTTSKSELLKHAITELKKRREVAVTYSVELRSLPDNIRVGDRVNIVDEEGELYLSSRLLKLETSRLKEEYTAEFGEHVVKSSGISEQLKGLADKVAGIGSKPSLYTWIAYADDAEGSGISLSSTGKEYLGTSPNHQSAEADISDPSVYAWMKVRGDAGEKGVGLTSVTRFYQMAAEKPEKPEAATPEEPWSATEPGYDDVEENALYYVDRTVFTDGSHAYSEVQTASSYDAAKDSYTQAKADIDATEDRLSGSIDSVSDAIMSEVEAEYYTNADADALMNTINASITESADSIESSFAEQLGSLSESTDARFDDLSAYIRVEDGTLVLGRTDSDNTLRLTNEKLALLSKAVEVAYLAYNKLFISDAQITGGIRIGDFLLQQSSTGRLDIQKAPSNEGTGGYAWRRESD